MATTKKVSVRAAVRDAVLALERQQKQAAKGKPLLSAVTGDGFVNFMQKLGYGADNALTSGTYGFNPITRNRNLLEWIHRGSWLGGVAVDLVADDMTRAGVDVECEMDPADIGTINRAAVRLNIWPQTNEGIKWSRLYGGSCTVVLVDGQDMRTPLRPETVGKGQFKGLVTFDRWMLEPSLSDLVTELGPHLGMPKYYTVGPNAPALRGQTVHYSRVAFRLVGIELPYQQRLIENLWGISVLERLYDRMIGFDSASTGAAQLVFKSYLRTLKIAGLRDIVAAGGKLMSGLTQYVEVMRRFQGIEGITMVDETDEFEVQGAGSAFSGISDVMLNLGQQLSGALQVPLVRLFGQSPAGLNSSGESDIRTYYDGIGNRQNKDLLTGTELVYRLVAQGEGIRPPEDFAVEFRSLWDLDDVQKAEVAKKNEETVQAAFDAQLIGRQTALKELRNMSRKTGTFSNITSEMIDAADDEVLPPMAEDVMAQEHDLKKTELGHEHEAEMAEAGHERALEMQEKRDAADAKAAKGAPADGAAGRKRLRR